jgi:hypothetical protein
MTCWDGSSPSAFEVRLLKPFDDYVLEQFRLRFLFSLTSPSSGVKSARVLMQMAFETEIGTVLGKMIPLPVSVPETTVCERRRFNDIDKDMQLQRFLVGPALDALETTPGMPSPYMDLIRRYATSDYPRYRVCALAASLCLATFLRTP